MWNKKLILILILLLSFVPKLKGYHSRLSREFDQRNLIESDNEIINNSNETKIIYNVGVLMASHLNSPFDLERCGPAVDLALERVNEIFLKVHNVQLRKVQGR